MNKRPDAMIYAIALGVIVVIGIVTTTIIDVIRNNQGAADIRAKAGVTSTLKLTGTVESVDEAGGSLTVSDVQFAAESRSGKAVNYGTWKVIPPTVFNILSAVPGVKVTFTVNSDSFNVSSKQVVAAAVTVLK